MTSKEVILTQSGLKKLEEELTYLKSVKRREVAARIKTAISFGDLSENAEYDNAKNEQAFIEGKIITLEKMIRNARLIEDNEVSKDIVGVGCTVRLQDMEANEELEFTIVGTAESDPANNRISNESPVGQAIIGYPVGAEVDIKVPAGTIKYKILEIK
jgi:transcription elongation factor GreA